ncbi:FAD-dependent oxidoreductase [Saccharopolyspora sp. WRP15-2]|uniref:FAD-dependent oxidoreductase n=1 Tax=Saccharopolyspora oryzae TaxID=2997343 RepID=A0ABT4V4C1_9PSEU|nr:FAD-dependent oxidoreductase [Saccharopolyspora oryzae]MDA3628784.1 FAD-dependent oxidoreductase [Saccharopolyspora oryzae]
MREAPLEAALAEAEVAVHWTDRADRPSPREPLTGDARADLVVVGGGFTGLWAAIEAKQRRPELDVLLLEAHRLGHGGSGRNGGFLSESLTHGLAHGALHWPSELDRLVELGRENLLAIEEFVREQGIDADLRLCGKTSVAIEPHEVTELSEEAELYREHGMTARFLGAGGVRADVDSPTYRAGIRLPDAGGLVDPARLTWGLADAAQRLGVRVHESSPVRGVRERGGEVRLRTPRAEVRANGVVLGTNAFRAPLRTIRRRVLPIWDYVLVTEPLSEQQWAELGWRDRQGITDSANRFHYYRPTPDGRILWGGYDAVYYFGGRTDQSLAGHDAAHRQLARNFFRTFPQLEGVRFTHRWGGPIDSTTRFTPLIGRTGRIAYAVGYTGLGVAASRFGARTALDLLWSEDTERTRLELVRRKPMPFPPEPLRWPLVQLTRRALARADENAGRRGRWLSFLDRRGIGLGS